MEWTRKSVEGLISAWSLEPCLLHVRHGLYHNKHARREARIVEKLKELGGPQTIQDIQNKMKSLRTTSVHELNKKLKSTKSGSGLMDVYQPSVWYFHKLNFLLEHVQPRRSIMNLEGICSSPINLDIGETHTDLSDVQRDVIVTKSLEVIFTDDEVRNSQENSITEVISQVISLNSTQHSSTSRIERKRKRKNDDKEGVLEKAHAVLDKISNDRTLMSSWDAFGQYVAATLKGVKQRKLQLQAKRAILEILMNVEEGDADGE